MKNIDTQIMIATIIIIAGVIWALEHPEMIGW